MDADEAACAPGSGGGVCLLAPLLPRGQAVGFGARRPSPGLAVGGQEALCGLLSSSIPGGLSGVEVRPVLTLGPAVGQYTSPVARRCCQDGLTRLPMTRSCEQRAARVPQLACREPFLSCCQFAEGLRKKTQARGRVGLARGEPGGGTQGELEVRHGQEA